MKKSFLFVLGFSIFLSFSVSIWGADDSFLDSLEKRGIEIRKSFNGTSKDSASPATFTYFNADDGGNYYGIDVAAKITEWSWDRGAWQGRIFPTFEYHRRTKTYSKLHKSEFGLISEVEKSVGTCEKKQVDGTVISYTYCPSLFIDTSYNFTKDSINDKTTRKASILGGVYGVKKNWPGYQFMSKPEGVFPVLRYLPMIGLEHYEQLPIERKDGDTTILVAPSVNETFAVLKLNFEFRPFVKSTEGKLVFVANYSVRRLTGSSTFIDDTTNFVELSLDYYLDENQRVAFGVNYSKGENPSRNFLDERTFSIGLSFKL